MARTIVLNGTRMTDRDTLYTYLQEKLDLPKHFGHNLDALYDVLAEQPAHTRIFLIHPDDLIDQLGVYGTKVMATFRDAQRENRRIHFYPVNEDPATL